MRTKLLLVAALGMLASMGGFQAQPQLITVPDPIQPLVIRLTSPTRIATTRSGRLVVTDYKEQMVFTIDRRKLTITRSFAIKGRPTGVGVMGNVIYVGNETTRRVEMYSRWGDPLGVLGGNTVVGIPTDIAIDEGRKLLFVVDAEADHVKVFDLAIPGGMLVGAVGSPGDSDGNLQKPTGLVLDTVNQQVLVADYGDPFVSTNPRVLTFGYDGALVDILNGKLGMLGYSFSKPQGLLLNDAGHLFVVDAWLGRIIVYDRATGSTLREIGDYGTGPQQLRIPLDAVLVGPSQDLYVTNNRSSRIEVYLGEGGS